MESEAPPRAGHAGRAEAAASDAEDTVVTRYEPPPDVEPTTARVELRARAVATADHNACAVAEDGAVWCWGFDMRPAVGPTRLAGPANAAVLDISSYGGCVATEDGEVWCWGPLYGTDDEPRSSDVPEAPTRVELADVVDLDVGHGQACAVLRDGSVRCWGCLWPGHWQGVGGCERTHTPAPVPGIDDAVEVAVAGSFACARNDAGEVHCWGGSRVGSPTPRRAPGIPLATSITGEFDEVCAVTRWGDVSCFEPPRAPQPRLELRGVSQVTVGGATRCGVKTDGTVVCAPEDHHRMDLVRQALPLLRPASFVAHNREVTCVLGRDRRVQCFGEDRMGGVGSPYADRRYTPAIIDGLDDVEQIAAAGSQGSTTCARRVDGSVLCWGAEPALLLADDARPRSRPTPVPVGPATDIAVGVSIACVVHASGRVSCWGEAGEGVMPVTEIQGVADARDVAASQDACIATAGSGVHCLSPREGRRTPMPVSGTERVVSLASVDLRTFLGSTADGETRAWRSNMVNGSTGAAEPVRGIRHAFETSHARCVVDESQRLECATRETTRVLGEHVGAACGGQAHGCFVDRDGSVDCWGEMWGEIGGPDDHLAVRRVPLPEAASDVVCGDQHACALLASKRVACWGRRGSGQLGDGTVGRYREPLTITIPVD